MKKDINIIKRVIQTNSHTNDMGYESKTNYNNRLEGIIEKINYDIDYSMFEWIVYKEYIKENKINKYIDFEIEYTIKDPIYITELNIYYLVDEDNIVRKYIFINEDKSNEYFNEKEKIDNLIKIPDIDDLSDEFNSFFLKIAWDNRTILFADSSDITKRDKTDLNQFKIDKNYDLLNTYYSNKFLMDLNINTDNFENGYIIQMFKIYKKQRQPPVRRFSCPNFNYNMFYAIKKNKKTKYYISENPFDIFETIKFNTKIEKEKFLISSGNMIDQSKYEIDINILKEINWFTYFTNSKWNYLKTFIFDNNIYIGFRYHLMKINNPILYIPMFLSLVALIPSLISTIPYIIIIKHFLFEVIITTSSKIYDVFFYMALNI